jgi:nitroreductase
MDVIEAIRSRKSIRGYKPIPVPEEVISEILRAAIQSPSTMNTQPWKINLITGESLEKLRKGNVRMLNEGVRPHPETHLFRFEDKYRQRQVDLAKQIFGLIGIAREDKKRRAEWMERGFRIFDAPAAIILSMDRSLDKSALSMLDMGAIMQTICLAALKYGLGTCIEDLGIMYPEVVRDITGISESEQIIICIAIGYPDWDFPANKLETVREPLDSMLKWYR